MRSLCLTHRERLEMYFRRRGKKKDDAGRVLHKNFLRQSAAVEAANHSEWDMVGHKMMGFKLTFTLKLVALFLSSICIKSVLRL